MLIISSIIFSNFTEAYFFPVLHIIDFSLLSFSHVVNFSICKNFNRVSMNQTHVVHWSEPYYMCFTLGMKKIAVTHSLTNSLRVTCVVLLFYMASCETKLIFFRSISYMQTKKDFFFHGWHRKTTEWRKRLVECMLLIRAGF